MADSEARYWPPLDPNRPTDPTITSRPLCCGVGGR